MSKLYHCIESKVVKENDYYIILETRPYMAIRTQVERISLDANGNSLDYIKNIQRRKIIEEVYGQYINELRDVVAMIWRNEDRSMITDKINDICDHMWGSLK